ncbi:c-type cytochrome [Lentibacter algarum]|uniref:c-type cytochrome n=1 Tax=Lentibacter algarum TaxID=576131 RepID=UPI001C06E5B4|nr:c-type cytochrome [Lentibacter algarum]MBU2980857.1 c-type cytochrome [Lentibacter algarum]
MKTLLTATALAALALPAFAEGDVEKGEKVFKRCKACHTIASEDEVIFKGGKTGPNLYGVIGRVAGSQEGFKYSKGLTEAAEAEFVWTEETLAAYSVDPKAWLGDNGYDPKSKMSFKLKKGGEDVAAYLASVGPVMEEAAPEAEAETTEEPAASE